MGGSILLWIVIGGVISAVAGGVGYALAMFSHLKGVAANDRTREELQKLLAAAESRAALALAGQQTTSAATSSPTMPTSPNVAPASHQQGQPENQNRNDLPGSEVQHAVASEKRVEAQNVQTCDAVPGNLLQETVEHTHTDVQCIVDIDHLRSFAEKHGEEFAAHVGKHVEQVLRDTLADFSPLISRYEGQEFIVAWSLPPGSDRDRLRSARKSADAMRDAVERAFLQVGSERVTVTISTGLALCEDGLAGEELLARADEALAAAKKAGRNCGYFFHHDKCVPTRMQETAEESAVLPEQYASSSGRSLSQIIAEKKLGHRDRRKHERKPCSTVNLIAPCNDSQLPSMDKFQRVQFFDISVSGFSMIVSSVPPTDHFAVALINSQGMIFMAAEIANIRQAPRPSGNGKPLLLVGCRFRQRLHPTPETNVARRPAEIAGTNPPAGYQPQRV